MHRGKGEHCLSSAVGRGVCAPPGRVAQPPDGFIQPKEAAGWRNGAAFLWLLSLAAQRK